MSTLKLRPTGLTPKAYEEAVYAAKYGFSYIDGKVFSHAHYMSIWNHLPAKRGIRGEIEYPITVCHTINKFMELALQAFKLNMPLHNEEAEVVFYKDTVTLLATTCDDAYWNIVAILNRNEIQGYDPNPDYIPDEAFVYGKKNPPAAINTVRPITNYWTISKYRRDITENDIAENLKWALLHFKY